MDKMRCGLKGFVKDETFEHSCNTGEVAKDLAVVYGVSEEDAYVAGLLHDVAKDLDINDYSNYGIDAGKIENFDYFFDHSRGVIHSFAGVQLAGLEFGIKDKHILDAIESHTLGKPNMSKLDKMIYIADKIEPSRDFDGVDELRDISYKDLDRAFEQALKKSIEFVLEKKHYLCLRTVDAWNSLHEEKR